MILCLPSAAAGEKTYVLSGEVHLPGQGRLRSQRVLVSLRGAREPFLAQAWTSLGGKFRFKNVPAGLYVLSAQASGFAVSLVSVDVSESLADAKGEIHRVMVLEPGSGDEDGRVSIAQLAVSQKAWRTYAKAENLLGLGKVDQAALELKKAIDKEPGFSQAHNLLGTIAYQRGKYEQAEERFRTALEVDPHAYAPLVNLGGALNSLQRFDEALDVNRRAQQERPDDALANAQLGLCYWGLGEVDKAIEFLSRAKQLDPGHFSFPQLALAQIFLSRGDVARTREELQEFLQLHPDAAQAAPARRLLEQLASNRP